MNRNVWLGVGAVALAAGAGGWWMWGRGAEVAESSLMRGALDYRCADRSKLYLGQGSAIRTPAVVRADAAYALIPEYRRIRAEGISPNGPQYDLLMKAASDRFLEVLRPIAASHGRDTVAEAGAIQVLNPAAAEPLDLTSEVLAALSRR